MCVMSVELVMLVTCDCFKFGSNMLKLTDNAHDTAIY